MITAGEILISIAMIIAIIVGPIIAVIVTRINDYQRDERQRKLDIFRSLMRTRNIPLHQDHVGALNLVEVEFIKHHEVILAQKNYLQNLSEKQPPEEEKDLHNDAVRQRQLLTKLIYEIAKSLKIEIEQLDILKESYVPQVWYEDYWQQRRIQREMLNVFLGKTPILIELQQPQQLGSPYPPKPSQE